VVVFHATAYGGVVSSAPSDTPSSLNCTPTTPVVSVAVAVTETVPLTTPPAAGAVTETAGGTVSLNTVTVTAAEVAVLPAASRATAVTTWLPLVTGAITVVGAAPVVMASAVVVPSALVVAVPSSGLVVAIPA